MSTLRMQSYLVRNVLIYLLLLIAISHSAEAKEKEHLYGRILEVELDHTVNLLDGEPQREQLLLIELEDGSQIETVNSIPPNLNYQVVLSTGDNVVLTEIDGAYFIEGHRIDVVLWTLIGGFFCLMILVGGFKGVLSVVSLTLKGGLLIFVLLPALKSGASPLWCAATFCIVATLLTMTFVSGINLKTVSATAGTILGVLCAGLIGTWSVGAAKLSGMLEPEMQALFYQFPRLNVVELISGGVLIGALGAVMDVAISVASSMYEVHQAAPQRSTVELYSAGMNVGKDVMGTMVNTLLLAYAGGALPTILLLSDLDGSYLMNTELVAKEIILAVVGSVGLVLTIPATAALSALLYKRLASRPRDNTIYTEHLTTILNTKPEVTNR